MNNDNNNIRNIMIKVLLLGDTDVGKTCLINTYFERPFNPYSYYNTFMDIYTQKR